MQCNRPKDLCVPTGSGVEIREEESDRRKVIDIKVPKAQKAKESVKGGVTASETYEILESVSSNRFAYLSSSISKCTLPILYLSE